MHPTTRPLSDAQFRDLLLLQLPRLRRQMQHLLRARARRGRAHDAEDLVQEVLVALLSEGPAAVSWCEPERGPIEQGILLAAERLARSYLRSGRRSGWAEVPTAELELQVASQLDLEAQLIARRELAWIAAQLERRFGERGANVMAARISGHSLSHTCDELELTPNALYCLRRRLKAAAAHVCQPGLTRTKNRHWSRQNWTLQSEEAGGRRHASLAGRARCSARTKLAGTSDPASTHK